MTKLGYKQSKEHSEKISLTLKSKGIKPPGFSRKGVKDSIETKI